MRLDPSLTPATPGADATGLPQLPRSSLAYARPAPGFVRAMALGQITRANARKLFSKELSVSALNGLIWGSVVGIFAFVSYHNWQLGLVMMLAMMLNLLLAACMGVLIPMVMDKFGRDPAIGASVMITAITDSGGFFIFLGLATLFLV